jgi:hypothetical protein
VCECVSMGVCGGGARTRRGGNGRGGAGGRGTGRSVYPVAYPSNLQVRPQKNARLSCLLLLCQSVSSTIFTDVEIDGNRSITCSPNLIWRQSSGEEKHTV